MASENKIDRFLRLMNDRGASDFHLTVGRPPMLRVSGGIEQNNEDVSRRINVLGEQLMRIEQVTQSAVRGPKIPVERYAGTAPAEEMSEHEPAFVNDGR